MAVVLLVMDGAAGTHVIVFDLVTLRCGHDTISFGSTLFNLDRVLLLLQVACLGPGQLT